MRLKKYLICIILFTLLSFSGCDTTGTAKTDQFSFAEGKIYLTEFKYIHKGKENSDAYLAMKNFPVKKIMYLISQEYNTDIDLSDFTRFIQNGNSSEIKTEGFFRPERFTWRSGKSQTADSISIVFEKDYFNESEMKFSVDVFKSGKKIKSVSSEFDSFEYLFKRLKYYFKNSEKSAADYDKNNYESMSSVPGLIFSVSSGTEQTDADVKTKIKTSLEEYVKTLSSDEKKQFRHEIIDHIYKICE